MSDYPENIRQFDNDPRSPFYNGPDSTVDLDELIVDEWCISDDNHAETVLEALTEQDGVLEALTAAVLEALTAAVLDDDSNKVAEVVFSAVTKYVVARADK